MRVETCLNMEELGLLNQNLNILLFLFPSSTEKVVGSATPREPMAECQAAWDFSIGYELMISWESSCSTSGLKFTLTNQTSSDSSVM